MESYGETKKIDNDDFDFGMKNSHDDGSVLLPPGIGDAIRHGVLKSRGAPIQRIHGSSGTHQMASSDALTYIFSMCSSGHHRHKNHPADVHSHKEHIWRAIRL